MDRDTRSVHRFVQPAGDSEDRVADRLRLEAPHRHPVEEEVVRVEGVDRGVELAGHRVCSRKHQFANQALYAPAFFHESVGEEVEQFGVGRTLAEHSEVVGRGNDSASEQMVPNAVDDHTARKRLGGVDNPLGQGETTASSFGVGDRLIPGDRLEKPARHNRARGLGRTSNQERLIERRSLEHGRSGWRLLRNPRGDRFMLLEEPLDLGLKHAVFVVVSQEEPPGLDNPRGEPGKIVRALETLATEPRYRLLEDLAIGLCHRLGGIDRRLGESFPQRLAGRVEDGGRLGLRVDNHRDRKWFGSVRAQLDVRPKAPVILQIMSNPTPLWRFPAPVEQKRVMERPDDHQVRINDRIRMPRALNEIPQGPRLNTKFRGSQGFARAVPTPDAPLIADVPGGVRGLQPARLLDRGRGGLHIEVRLTLRPGFEHDFSSLPRPKSEAVTVL